VKWPDKIIQVPNSTANRPTACNNFPSEQIVLANGPKPKESNPIRRLIMPLIPVINHTDHSRTVA
jgi:hypothetical protein